MYNACLRCTQGCSKTFEVTEAVYRCPSCDGLLEVHHDSAALRDRSAAAWMKLFDDRYKRTFWPYGSGVWGKREWVMPMMPDDLIVSMDEGGTNLYWAERYGKQLGLNDVWVKLCGNSHTGSFKDLGMTVLVSVVRMALARGGLKVKAIACASTGDTSASLAAYGAAAGLPVVVLLPKGKVSTTQLVQPLANGAKVLALETDFDGCMAIVKQLAAEGLVYLANSMNPLRIEGQKTVAIEMVQQFDWQVPDWVILPSGNLGNASALYAGFQMMLDTGVIARMPRLCVAQAENANPMYRAWVKAAGGDTSSENEAIAAANRGYRAGEKMVLEPVKAQQTLATAIQIGNPVSFPRAIKALDAMNGIVTQASEEELAEAAARADRTGMYTCPHTAVALAALEKLAANGTIKPDERVIVVSTASGLKFTEFKVGYHERALSGVRAQGANQPVTLAADFGTVADAVRSL